MFVLLQDLMILAGSKTFGGLDHDSDIPPSIKDDSQGRSKKKLPSRELTYPTLGKGKSSSKCRFGGIF